MLETVALSPGSQRTAGILLLALVTVEWGGLFVLRLVRGQVPATDLQKAFARAGHAHAGVLLTLGLICQVLVDATGLQGLAAAVARSGVPVAALLMPAGFFFSSMGRGVTRPNRLVLLVHAGAVSLACGLIVLGVGLLAG